jgi:LPXTG-motif cell wall-anchored protein
VRVQAWQLHRSRARSAGVITIVVVAVVLVFARPAWAHSPSASGTTSCPDANHIVSWTINNPDTDFGAATILSATARLHATNYAVTGYDASIPPAGSTHATTTVPGGETGSIRLTVRVRWADNFEGEAKASVELQPPCNETTTVPSTTTPSTTTPSTTAPSSSTSPSSGPPVSGGGVSPTGLGATTTAPGGGAAGAEAGAASGSLPRTGSPSTNWALVGFASFAFGGLLLAASSKRGVRGLRTRLIRR